MSKKLFSLEDNDLLQVADNPLELTKKLLAQKEEIKKELKNKFLNLSDKDEKNTEEKKNIEIKKIEKTNIDEESDNEENAEDNQELKKIDENKNQEAKDEEDVSSAALDKDSLKALVGSAEKTQDSNNDSEQKIDVKKEQESKDEEAKDEEDISSAALDKDSLKALVGSAKANESIFIPKYKNINLFNPLYIAYESYLNSLAKYRKLKPLSLEEQKVVYVKDAILEVLNNIINSVNKYIGKNNSLYSEFSVKLSELNKDITIYQEALNHTSYAFNFKLVKDEDIILNLSIDNKPDLRSSIQSLTKFLETTTTLVNLIINNDIENLSDAFIQSNFKLENNEYEYSSSLPAFNTLKAKISNYVDYKNTDITSYEIYKIQHINQENINSLTALDVSNDKDFQYYIENTNKILFELSSLLEVLMTLNTNFNSLLEKIKANIYDIENNKVDNLQSLSIDETIKTVIKFKLSLDVLNIAFRICFNFLSSLVKFLKLTVEVKTLTS